MAIMISIRPEWVEKILSGEKTIEIRKTMPKCSLPQKVYIYCTKGKELWGDGTGNTWNRIAEDEDLEVALHYTPTLAILNGKVVAEFTLNNIEILWQNHKDKSSTAMVVDKETFEKLTCLTWKQYCEYHKCRNGKYPNSYAWQIDNLKIYDKPKELNEFKKQNCCYKNGNYEELGCWECCCPHQEYGECDGRCSRIEKPPQSWCYCEELEEV